LGIHEVIPEEEEADSQQVTQTRKVDAFNNMESDSPGQAQ
jgi:hypothetical protein